MKSEHKLIFRLVLILTILGVLLCGCQPTASDVSEPVQEEEAQNIEEPEDDQASEPTDAPEMTEQTEPLSIVLLTGGPAEDGGFYQTFYTALLAVDDYFGDDVETLVVEFVTASEEATRTIEQLIADGADMIIDAATLLDFAEEAAAAHPEVAFLRADLVFQENEATIYKETGRPYYLIGVTAGLLSETGKIGFIDAFPSAYGDAWLNAVALGARSVNPEATVTAAYIGSWYDPTAARQAAEALVSNGIDFLFGSVNMDTVISVAEEKGVWASGGDLPLGEFGPDVYANTVALDFNDHLIGEVQNLVDGTWEGNTEYRIITIGDGEYLDWGANVPQDVVDTIEGMFDEMADGWNPFVGPIMDNQGNVVVAEGEELTDFDFFWGVEYLVDGVIRSE